MGIMLTATWAYVLLLSRNRLGFWVAGGITVLIVAMVAFVLLKPRPICARCSEAHRDARAASSSPAQRTAAQIPVDDASVDLVISNGVINLAADNAPVFREIARILKPGGRVQVSECK